MSITFDDSGVARCWWGTSTPDYVAYHDTEWGFGVSADNRLFEKLCLEGFQSGLSWLTILRKREGFRRAFADFEPSAVADFDHSDVRRLLGDPSIIRHEGKITAAINNGRRALELIDEFGSLAAYFWPHSDGPDVEPPSDIPAITERSTAIAKDLKRRGFRFVGPTTMYAFMQAMGMVNDHLAGCSVRDRCETSRLAVRHRVLSN